MATATLETVQPKYKVADIGLADWGRKEITIAEQEMPGLMSIRRKYAAGKPLAGVRITGSLHMTIQTAVLIETLVDLGADVRWASCNIFSTQDHAAAAIAAAGVPVFAWKGETLEEYWWCTDQALSFPRRRPRPATRRRRRRRRHPAHPQGLRAREWRHSWVDSAFRLPRRGGHQGPPEDRSTPRLPRAGIDVVKEWRGVSEETTTGVHRLYKMLEQGKLLVPAINVNDSVTKSKFDNLYGCRESLVDGIKRATDVMVAGKVAVVCGYGDVGKGSAALSCAASAPASSSPRSTPSTPSRPRWKATKSPPIEDTLGRGDIYVTSTGNVDIITLEHMQQDEGPGHRLQHRPLRQRDPDGAAQRLRGRGEARTSSRRSTSTPSPTGNSIFMLAEGRLVNLGCATGHPSFVMSNSFANQTLAQLDLWENKDTYKLGVYILPKKLDEEVARLHLEKIGVKLTTLTEKQADYLSVPVEGPYKSDHYRY